MATGKETETTFENPLIPNARLRQIYVAMVQARLLGEALARPRRGGTAETLGLEAILAGTSVEFASGDLVSDGLGGGVVEFLRGATLESALRPDEGQRKRGFKANCCKAARMPAVAGIRERMWAALGAAAALKARRTQEKADAAAGTETQTGVVAVYARADEVTPALWQEALAFATVEELPVLFVVLPGLKATKPGAVSAVALRHGVPGIPVDADDSVAIYRVTQEAIGRARIGGGAALMECVPFLVAGARGKAPARADAIAVLERYMLGRGVATKSWMEREAKSFARRVAR